MRAFLILMGGLCLGAAIFGARWAIHSSGEPTRGHPAPVREGASETADSLPPPIQPGDAVPDATLVGQDGREFRLSDFRGHVVVMAFIYTHCNMTSMCPLATAKFVEAQRLSRERGIDGLRFLLVSFDARRDRPERLREFAATYGADPETLTFATGESASVARLARALNTFYRQSTPGVFEHTIVVSVIDRTGLLRDDFFGTGWEVEELVEAVDRVARESLGMREPGEEQP